MIDEQLLRPEERAGYALRTLYHRYGYTPYKMSKFEEYDLYAKNKDFLISEGIITFTDARGRLLALKPDVTLSIIKNSRDVEGGVSKVYYNESVYRIAKGSHTFKEIMQTGLECIGKIDAYQVAEVVSLALRSLSLLSDSYMLDLSHVGLIGAIIADLALPENSVKPMLSAVEQKNSGALSALVADGTLSLEAGAFAEALLSEYATVDAAEQVLAPYVKSDAARAALDELRLLFSAIEALGLSDRVRLDFSVVNHRGYYSGVVFKGYVKGIPDSVLAGGQYDRMMRKMGRRDGAIGFAVYLDAVASFARAVKEYDTDILLFKNGASATAVLRAVSALSKDGASVLAVDDAPIGIRARRCFTMVGEEALENGND